MISDGQCPAAPDTSSLADTKRPTLTGTGKSNEESQKQQYSRSVLNAVTYVLCVNRSESANSVELQYISSKGLL
jgi:hypothetical protein